MTAISLSFVLLLLALGQPGRACNDIILQDPCSTTETDAAVVSGRTLSFPAELGPSVALVPAGTEVPLLQVAAGIDAPVQQRSVWSFACISHSPDAFKSLYPMSDTINHPDHLICSDGLNEKGLSVGLLYQDDTTGMAYYDSNSTKASAINFVDLTTYLLARYATAADAAQDLADKLQVVWNPAYDGVGKVVTMGAQVVPPMHVIVHDATGASLVIQFRDNVMEVLDNQLGVFANSPFLQEHMQEYDSWMQEHNYTKGQAPASGSKWIIPGDYSSSSRFIRMAMIKTATMGQCWSTNVAGEQQLLSPGHVPVGYPATNPTLLAVAGILQSVYLPRGVDDDGGADSTQPMNMEVTPYTTLRDHKAAIFYYRTGNSMTYRSVSLQSVDWSQVGGMIHQELLPPATPWVEDVTQQLLAAAPAAAGSSSSSSDSISRRNGRRLKSV